MKYKVIAEKSKKHGKITHDHEQECENEHENRHEYGHMDKDVHVHVHGQGHRPCPFLCYVDTDTDVDKDKETDIDYVHVRVRVRVRVHVQFHVHAHVHERILPCSYQQATFNAYFSVVIKNFFQRLNCHIVDHVLTFNTCFLPEKTADNFPKLFFSFIAYYQNL
jgi:hypothetical protein